MPYQPPTERQEYFVETSDGVSVCWTTTTLPNSRYYYLQAWAEEHPEIEVLHAYIHAEEVPAETRARVFGEIAACVRALEAHQEATPA